VSGISAEAVVLWTHVAAGVVALLAGAGALVTNKGGGRHRFAGRQFVRAMAVVVGTVPLLLAFDPTSFARQFLTLVAVFSGYFAFTGYRVLARKRPAAEAAPVDWAAAVLVVVASLALAGLGVALLLRGGTFGIVLLVFGLLGGGFGFVDVRGFRAPEGRNPWLVDHLTRMIGAFIATVSAVSVVNLSATLGVVAWLWPTAAFTPLTLYWQAKYADEGPLVDVVKA
jgi:uncharacterized membrane protein